MSYRVCFSFPMIFRYLAILQVLQSAFLIFHVFECFLPHYRSYSFCVSFFMFFSFHAINRVLQCAFLIFHLFECFALYSGSKIVVGHFPTFSVFLSYSRSYSVPFSFSPFSVFLAIFHLLQCVFLIFHDFQFSRHIPGLIILHF
jgi:hypothetical protein